MGSLEVTTVILDSLQDLKRQLKIIVPVIFSLVLKFLTRRDNVIILFTSGMLIKLKTQILTVFDNLRVHSSYPKSTHTVGSHDTLSFSA